MGKSRNRPQQQPAKPRQAVFSFGDFLAKHALLGSMIAGLAVAGWTVFTFVFPNGFHPFESARMLAQGNNLLDIGRYVEARQAFEEAAKLNPLNSEAAWGLKKAKAWEATNPAVFEEAIKNLALEKPDDAHVKLFQCQFHASSHSPEDRQKATAECKAAKDARPSLAEAHFILGMLHDQSGDWNLAEAEYKTAAARSGTTPKYHNNLAYLYFKRKDYQKALDEYAENSQFPLSALESAKIYWRLGGPKDLQAAFEMQTHALQWLDSDEIKARPEQRDPWYFEVGGEGIEAVSWEEKKSYAALCLSLTQFLQGQAKAAEELLKSLPKPLRQATLDEILRADLRQLEQARPDIAAPLAEYRRRFLDKPVQ